MDSDSESLMESRVRVLIVSAPSWPKLQIVIRDMAGRFIGRADMGYEAARLLIDDGAVHWAQLAEDDRRRYAMRALGVDGDRCHPGRLLRQSAGLAAGADRGRARSRRLARGEGDQGARPQSVLVRLGDQRGN